MNKFIIKISLFFFTAIIIFSLLVKTIPFGKKTENVILLKKKKYFENFIEDRTSFNLILGSSLSQDILIPDSLGLNWFCFSNNRQNIYNSYKFLNYYGSSISIDTAIICLGPWDFPYSYIKSRNDIFPFNRFDFFIFGSDSLQYWSFKDNVKLPIQRKIDELPNFSNLKRLIKEGNFYKESPYWDVWTKQGFSGRINDIVINMKKQHLRKDYEGLAKFYFENVKNNPNLKYFNLMNDTFFNKDTKVIYLITPKSKLYSLELNEHGNDEVWNTILDSLNSKNIEIWNYENMVLDTFKFNFLNDDTHASYDGAKVFTKIIKNRLKEN